MYRARRVPGAGVDSSSRIIASARGFLVAVALAIHQGDLQVFKRARATSRAPGLDGGRTRQPGGVFKSNCPIKPTARLFRFNQFRA